MKLQLYSYFRSSSAYRVRIGLNIKGLKYEYLAVHLLQEGGQQNKRDYTQLNPMAEVPSLVHDGFVLSQSMAILLYLDEIQSQPKLFPKDIHLRHKVIQFCENINSGIQPIQNLRVLNALGSEFGAVQADKARWASYWIRKGLAALEASLVQTAGTYCFAGEVTAADVFLAPQVYNALRFSVDLNEFPTLKRVYLEGQKLKAFQDAAPEKQPDFKE